MTPMNAAQCAEPFDLEASLSLKARLNSKLKNLLFLLSYTGLVSSRVHLTSAVTNYIPTYF